MKSTLVRQVHNCPIPPTDTAERAPPEPSQDLSQAQLCVVQEMIDAGLDLVRAIRREAQEAAAGEATDLEALSRSYAQVTRAVRLTMAIQTRITNDTFAADLKAREERAAAAERAALIRERKIKTAIAVVEAVHLAGRPPAESERLLEQADAWMERETEAFATGSIGQAVERICADLGVPFDPVHWQDEPWAIEETLSHAPGSPYAFRGHTRVPPAPIEDDDDGAPEVGMYALHHAPRPINPPAALA